MSPPPALFYSVREVSKMLGLSHWTVYELLDDGAMESRYIGRRRLIPTAAFHAFVDSLPTERDISA